jgi:hypothetical protein
VGTRPNPKKKPIPNSPIKNLFVKQRETLKFPQKQKLQLVTLFSVRLRQLPFSEPPQKNSNQSKLSKTPPIDLISAHSRRPIIKGPPPDLILFVTRLL